jgi:hypothetical protein
MKKEYELIIKVIKYLMNEKKRKFVCNNNGYVEVRIPISNELKDEVLLPYGNVSVVLARNLPIDAVCAETDAPLENLLRELAY